MNYYSNTVNYMWESIIVFMQCSFDSVLCMMWLHIMVWLHLMCGLIHIMAWHCKIMNPLKIVITVSTSGTTHQQESCIRM